MRDVVLVGYLFLIFGADSEAELVDLCVEAAQTFTIRTDGEHDPTAPVFSPK